MSNMDKNLKAYVILFLSWLVPGLGHFIQEKRVKAIVFFVGTLLLLTLGIIMKGAFYETEQMHPLMILGFLGDLGNGIFFFLIKLLGLGKGNIEAVTYHYGTTYMVSAGLINYLAALNAFDIARGKRK
jgi:TM2 domain-containing membrane protein YozV